MYSIDFEYDGVRLSDFGFMVCDFNDASGVNAVSMGSKLTFNKKPVNRGRRFTLINTQYDECYQTTFDICKKPSDFGYNGLDITENEVRDLTRWLNRGCFCVFHPINGDNMQYPCYFNASFNVDALVMSERIIGLRLTMETDSPFGYGEELVFTHEFTGTDNDVFWVDDMSDSIGSFCPNVEITCSEDGDLSIENANENCIMKIDNCVEDEVITINGKMKIISSNDDSHDISNDFNYDFLKLGNSMNGRKNAITSNLKCKIKVFYRPTFKKVL